MFAHGNRWLYVLSANQQEPGLPSRHVAGPFKIEPGKPIVARSLESWFPPGMRTRVHTHLGPEAFYVIEGEQCTETLGERGTSSAGESYIVPGGWSPAGSSQRAQRHDLDSNASRAAVNASIGRVARHRLLQGLGAADRHSLLP